MLYNPSYSFSVLTEKEFPEKILDIEKEISEYAHKGYFSSYDNKELYYEYYKVKDAKATLVFVHGYTEFLKKYYELTWYFMNMGYNVFLYDHRGHGYSHRDVEDLEITHIDSFDIYIKDLNEFMKKVVTPNCDSEKIYLYGHSMGGSIAILYLSQCSENIEKALISAPMIHPSSAKGPRWFLKGLLSMEAKKHGWKGMFKFSKRFNPDVKVEESLDSSLVRFTHNLNYRKNDPHYQNSASTNRWTYESISVKDKILSRKTLDKIRAKMLLVCGENDTIVRIKPQKKFAKMTACDFEFIKNAKHSLYTLEDKALEGYLEKVFAFFN